MNRGNSRRPSLFKRLNAAYRVVFIDDESLEEVATFNLTKSRIYMLFSTLFVMTVTVTVMILLFTPLRYYIPGYGDNRTHVQVVHMKHNVDSLSDLVSSQQVYLDNLKKVISGDYNGPKDTSMLDMDKVNREAMNGILPPAELIRQQAIQKVRKETKKPSNE